LTDEIGFGGVPDHASSVGWLPSPIEQGTDGGKEAWAASLAKTNKLQGETDFGHDGRGKTPGVRPLACLDDGWGV
jgi:hypothetical protein